MHRIAATTDPARLRTALAAVSRTDGIIVGPQWIDVATPGELARQLRRQRVIPLTQGVYGALVGDPRVIRETLAALIVLDVPRFTDALRVWDARNPNV